ncbi:MAG: M23 family metallopeptidase [Chthoniobacterales bacterium]|nr:M23 family metallopeptidase [Chthoniobacterales bacterium]
MNFRNFFPDYCQKQDTLSYNLQPPVVFRFLLLFFFLFSIICLHGEIKPSSIPLAEGFDFPVAPPNADEFYKSRGFRQGGHLGEDWVSINGGSGNSLGKPVFSIGRGMVILARDVHVAWGNVIVIRHAYFEQGETHFIDSLYAHLDRIDVKEGDLVTKGQRVGSIGNNHGMYPAHLHFEIHKNLNIGVNHTGFGKTLLNYWTPTEFIVKRRSCWNKPGKAILPLSHFDIPTPWSHTPKKHHSKKRSKKH